MDETYLHTATTVRFPDLALESGVEPTMHSISTTSRLRRDSKQESAVGQYAVRYDATRAPTAASSEESRVWKKRLNTMLCSAWRTVRKCIYSPAPSELDDVNSNTAQLLYADRYQPIYGYGSIAAGTAKPTTVSDNPSSVMDSTWASPQRGSNPRARPTPKENFVV